MLPHLVRNSFVQCILSSNIELTACTGNCPSVLAALLACVRVIRSGVTRQEPIALNDPAARLGQLVIIAVENLIRYTAEGGKVDVSLALEARRAVFCVMDTDIDIPEDEWKSIMQPFYRTQGSLQPGSGPGLATMQKIAQRLGGTIERSNRVEGGIHTCCRQPVVSVAIPRLLESTKNANKAAK